MRDARSGVGIRAAMVGVIGLAAVLRLPELGRESLWYDEALTAYYATRPTLSALLAQSARDCHPPGMNVLLWLWCRMAGATEAALRFPSALAGIAAVALIYRIGRRTGGAAVGCISALLLAVAPAHIWFSREARPYSMLLLLGLAATELAIELGEQPRSRTAAAYAAVMALALYVHYLAFLLLAAHGVFIGLVLFRRARAQGRWPKRESVLCMGAIGLALALFLPWAGALRQQLAQFHGLSALVQSRPRFVVAALSQMGPGDGLLAEWARTGALVVCAVLAVAARLRMPGGAAQAGTEPSRLHAIDALLCALLIPMAILAVVPSLRNVKSAMPWMPYFLLLMGAGVGRLTHRAHRAGIVATSACGLLALAALLLPSRYPARTPWRQALARVAERPDGPLVIAPKWADAPFAYYRSRDLRLAPLVVRHACRPRKDDKAIRAVLGTPPAVWLFEDDIAPECSLDELVEALAPQYTIEMDQRWPGVTGLHVRHLVRRGALPPSHDLQSATSAP